MPHADPDKRREYHKAYNVEYAKRNKERLAEQSKRWARSNPEKRRASIARHRAKLKALGIQQKHSPRSVIRAKERYYENRDSINQKHRQYYAENKARIRRTQNSAQRHRRGVLCKKCRLSERVRGGLYCKACSAMSRKIAAQKFYYTHDGARKMRQWKREKVTSENFLAMVAGATSITNGTNNGISPNHTQ